MEYVFILDNVFEYYKNRTREFVFDNDDYAIKVDSQLGKNTVDQDR
jgi:hypothetical protein